MTSPPQIRFTEPPTNTLEQCDAALGRYLRAWDQIEIQLSPLFNRMLGIHQNATLILLRAGLDRPTLRNILEALAPIRLKPADEAKLKRLVRRWKAASSKRNRIVHGHWQLNIEMVKGPSGKSDHTKSVWVQFYNPVDPTIMPKIARKRPDQKLRAAHRFELKDIETAAADVVVLARDVQAFNDRLTVLPFVTPQPINIDQSSIGTPTAVDGG